MRAFTDYPLVRLGDQPGKLAPIREVEVISCDGDKYCLVRVGGIETEIKSGYLYQTAGRCGDVPSVSLEELEPCQDQILTWSELHEKFLELRKLTGGWKASSYQMQVTFHPSGEITVCLGTYGIGDWPRITDLGPYDTEEDALSATAAVIFLATTEVEKEHNENERGPD